MRIEDLTDEELVGRIAKVGFGVPGPSRFVSEWMWVRITQVVGDLIYGELRNEPFHVPRLRHGDIVCFRAEHVFRGEAYVPGTEGILDPVSRMARGGRDRGDGAGTGDGIDGEDGRID
jgi:hypothetical protein